MSTKIKKIIPFLSAIPFIISTIGYLIEGEHLLDALYDSVSLYYFQMASQNFNILIEIARWTAPIAMTAVITCIFRSAWECVRRIFLSRSRHCAAVYGNNHIKSDNRRMKFIYSNDRVVRNCKKHIIIFEHDRDSIDFYNQNCNNFFGKTYICLREFPYTSLKGMPHNEKPKVTNQVIYFDAADATARMLWKDIKLWNISSENKSAVVTMIGSGHLAHSIMDSALLLNLFSVEQSVTYHVVSSDELYRYRREGMDLCNNDRIEYHPYDSDRWALISCSDIVVLCEEIPPDELIAVSEKCHGKVYFYAPSISATDWLELPNCAPFGKNSDVITYENICMDKLISDAMEEHYNYLKDSTKTREEAWNELSGFLKWSNISSADYSMVTAELYELRRESCEHNSLIEELSELEHIRWCRLHYLDHWTYSPERNDSKKQHHYLVDFNELDEQTKEKDRAVVRTAIAGMK